MKKGSMRLELDKTIRTVLQYPPDEWRATHTRRLHDKMNPWIALDVDLGGPPVRAKQMSHRDPRWYSVCLSPDFFFLQTQ